MHEARMHTHNCFLTLTYSDEHLPKDGNLDHRDFQLFLKKLREAATFPPRPKGGEGGGEGKIHTSTWLIHRGPLKGTRVAPYTAMARPVLKYHMCGEYGPTTSRQHYHANIFGINFSDRKPWKKTPAGYQLYKSETLDNLWGLGHASIGQLTWQTAAYTARYNLKKAGDKNKKKVEIIDITTGEVISRVAEYHKMSRRPGLASTWFEQYKDDVYPHGTVTLNAKQVTAPRYYDEKFRRIDPFEYTALKFARRAQQFAREYISVTEVGARSRAEETVMRAKLSFLKRNGDIT